MSTDLAGVENRSRLRAAEEARLDRTVIVMGTAEFQELLAWLDAAPTADELVGMKRLLDRTADWARA